MIIKVGDDDVFMNRAAVEMQRSDGERALTEVEFEVVGNQSDMSIYLLHK